MYMYTACYAQTGWGRGVFYSITNSLCFLPSQIFNFTRNIYKITMKANNNVKKNFALIFQNKDISREIVRITGVSGP